MSITGTYRIGAERFSNNAWYTLPALKLRIVIIEKQKLRRREKNAAAEEFAGDGGRTQGKFFRL